MDLSKYLGDVEKPKRGIIKRMFSNAVGVVVPKLAGEAKGFWAWRLWRMTPRDGVTCFGRAHSKVRQYYIGGGLCMSRTDAINFLVRQYETWEDQDGN